MKAIFVVLFLALACASAQTQPVPLPTPEEIASYEAFLSARERAIRGFSWKTYFQGLDAQAGLEESLEILEDLTTSGPATPAAEPPRIEKEEAAAPVQSELDRKIEALLQAAAMAEALQKELQIQAAVLQAQEAALRAALEAAEKGGKK